MSAAALKASLASLALPLVLGLGLAVWWSFFALQGCRREGSLSVAQVNLVPEDLGYLEAVWDLLRQVGCWRHNSLGFNGVGPV